MAFYTLISINAEKSIIMLRWTIIIKYLFTAQIMKLKLSGHFLYDISIARVNYVDTSISLIARTFVTLSYDKFSLQRWEIK